MSATTLSPQERRQSVYEQMTPGTKRLVQQMDKKEQAAALRMVLLSYDLGVVVAMVFEDAATYGPSAIEQMAKFLPISGGLSHLYLLRRFALEFDREFVKEEVSTPMDDGCYLSSDHFLELCNVSSQTERRRLLTRIRSGCLSALQLRREIRDCYGRGRR